MLVLDGFHSREKISICFPLRSRFSCCFFPPFPSLTRPHHRLFVSLISSTLPDHFVHYVQFMIVERKLFVWLLLVSDAGLFFVCSPFAIWNRFDSIHQKISAKILNEQEHTFGTNMFSQSKLIKSLSSIVFRVHFVADFCIPYASLYVETFPLNGLYFSVQTQFTWHLVKWTHLQIHKRAHPQKIA